MVTYSKNPEYPDLPFAWPAAYGESRYGRGWSDPLPRLIVVHHTAGQENAQSAEGGANYDQIRTDGTSAAYYVDPDSIVQCVPTWMRSNTAFRNGNTLGIHYELCGTLQTREQWLDANSRQIIRRAAAQMARDAAKWKIPLRKLTPAQVAAGEAGFCGHVDITYAFPADGGTHTDPGPDFPWDVLFADIEGVRDAVALTQTDLQNISSAVWEWFRAPGGINMQDNVVVIKQGVEQLLARPITPITISDEQALSIAAAVAGAVVIEDNPLTEADSPVIEAALLKALRSLVTREG